MYSRMIQMLAVDAQGEKDSYLIEVLAIVCLSLTILLVYLSRKNKKESERVISNEYA